MENDTATATKKAGRPQKYVNSAARQKAYRERMKKDGYREIKTKAKDVRNKNIPLTSDIIDLSQVSRHRITA